MRYPQAQLRRVFRIVNGGTPTSDEDNWGGDVAWATPADLAGYDGKVVTNTARTLTPVGLASGSRAVAAGSLLLSTRAPIGYVAHTNRSMAFNQGCRGLETSPAGHDARYFKYQLLARRSDLQAAGSGTTFQELSMEALGAFRVAVPDAGAQRRIADHLDAETARIGALIDVKQRMIDMVIYWRSSTIHEGVVGQLTRVGAPRKASTLAWVEDVPQHWREGKLALVAKLGSGHTPRRSHPEWWEECTIPWITTGEVAQMRDDRIEYISQTRELISEVGLANSSAVVHPAGTVVLCRTAASAGYSAIMATDMATSQDIATWTCGPDLNPRYLLLCLRSMRRDLLERLAMGSTHKTIYMPDIESIRVPIPPIDEQSEIVDAVWDRLRTADELTDTLSRQVEFLRERRQALITAAVTGEMEVP